MDRDNGDAVHPHPRLALTRDLPVSWLFGLTCLCFALSEALGAPSGLVVAQRVGTSWVREGHTHLPNGLTMLQGQDG